LYHPERADLPRDFPWDELQQQGGTLTHGRGCRACRQSGYLGRMGIYEMLVTTDRVRELAHKRASTWDLRKAGIEEGMVTLRQDGWNKVLAGRTSVDEVIRVTKSDRL
jgi:general secretion pathway protein E/type IV pilus assembly protein PilB